MSSNSGSLKLKEKPAFFTRHRKSVCIITHLDLPCKRYKNNYSIYFLAFMLLFCPSAWCCRIKTSPHIHSRECHDRHKKLRESVDFVVENV